MWYSVDNVGELDSPALLLYKERVKQNIDLAVKMATDPDRLRPHVKTNKMAEVCRMMMDAGINKFKCATIAEAEMLARIGAKDVLLAYQPVGPKAMRLLSLVKKYPRTVFSCVVDNPEAAQNLAAIFSKEGMVMNVMIDLNNGMDRTGISYSEAIDFFESLVKLSSLRLIGLHVYDGHIRESDAGERQAHSDQAFRDISALIKYIEEKLSKQVVVVAGGSPTFATHIKRDVQLSPGTFVFWDWGYAKQFPDNPFQFAVLVLTRIISVRKNNQVTVDLGYKAIASEGPLPRVHFLNAPDAEVLSHSEEHMVLRLPEGHHFKLGDELYGVPVHVCPTVALYENANVIENREAVTTWKVTARDRAISV